MTRDAAGDGSGAGSGAGTIGVLVADGHAMFRQGLRAMPAARVR